MKIPIHEINDDKLQIKTIATIKKNTNNYADIIKEIFKADKAEFEYHYIIALDAKYKPIGILEEGSGSTHSVQISYEKMALYLALTHAEYFVTVHNHPGGDPYPSFSDVVIFRKELDLFGSKLDDSIIISSCDDFSFYSDGFYKHRDHIFDYFNNICIRRLEDSLYKLWDYIDERLDNLCTEKK